MAAQPEYFNRWESLEDKWSGENMVHLVDLETGTQDSRCYTDETVYRRELERIFARCWICVGHDSQIPKPGDYFTTMVGEDPVIVTRHRDHTIHVMLNQCRHRRFETVPWRLWQCAFVHLLVPRLVLWHRRQPARHAAQGTTQETF